MTSTSGYPDWQSIAQWLGETVDTAAAFALGAGSHSSGPYDLSSWASVIVAVEPTGGPVVVTITQQVPGAPASLAVVDTFTAPAGKATFEAFVIFGSSVTVQFQGSVVGTTVDYAIYPANTTTNAQVASGGAAVDSIALASWPPASPADGDTHWLIIPASFNPDGSGDAMRWLCTYDAASNMWDVAAAAMAAILTASEAVPALGWTDLAVTAGPFVRVPVAGDYLVHGAASAVDTVNDGGHVVRVGVCQNNNNPPIFGSDWVLNSGIPASITSPPVVMRGMAANDVAKLRYNADSTSTTYNNRGVYVQPVRIV